MLKGVTPAFPILLILAFGVGLTAIASLTLASLAAEMATEEVLCFDAACAAADAAAFLLPFLPPAMFCCLQECTPDFFWSSGLLRASSICKLGLKHCRSATTVELWLEMPEFAYCY